MSAARWKQVQSVFHAVLDHDPSERGRLLADLCSNDESLREEVESLLRSHDTDKAFLSTPALGSNMVEAGLAAERASLVPTGSIAGELAGLAVDHYQIISLLGAGGMGEVYRARDLRLGRDVALKILPSSMPMNDATVRRFEQEILAVSAFSHPNICHLYDIGHWNGRRFFTMELLEGRTLRDLIRSRALTVAEILDYGIQIAGALETAHSKGILHRDIKPANIFVTTGGPVKVMDFGLAKRATPRGSAKPTASGLHTAPGAAMGTIAYMSPEQARAEELDARTDLFSFGIVLYEMATRLQPFRGASTAVVFEAILNQAPVPPSRINPELTEELERIFLTALEKDRDLRFQSAAEMRAAFKRVQRSSESAGTAHAAAIAGVPGRTLQLGEDESSSARSVAVLPFQMLQDRDNDEYLGVGLADAVITRLSSMKRLVVRPTSSVYRYAGLHCDLVTAGRELGVSYAIGGLVRRSNDQVRITVQLVNVRTGAQVWGTQLDETFTTLMSLEDSLARLAAEAIIPRLNAEERELLGKRDTVDPAAYEAYLRGRYHWSTYGSEGMAQALVCFMDAIAKDPNYARAHAGVADYYNWAGAWNLLPPAESFAAAKQAGSKAVSLDSALPETQTSYGYAVWNHDWDWNEAERTLRRAIDLNESYAPARSCLAFLLSAKGKHEEAIEQVEKAAVLDPLSPGVAAAKCLVLSNAGELDKAVEAGRVACAAASSTNATALLCLAWAASAKGLHAEAIQRAREAMAIAEDNAWAVSTLAAVVAASGEQAEALQLLAKLRGRGGLSPAAHYDFALIQAALHENDRAIASLEQSAACREWWIRFVRVDRRLQALHKHPRFAALCARVGNPIPGVAVGRIWPETGSRLPASGRVVRWSAWGIAVLLIAAGIGVYRYLSRESSASLFHAPQFTKVTSSGNAIIAALSPDGNYVAYALDEGGKSSLWVRQVSISNGMRIIPASDAKYRGLTFSRDGSWVYYVTYNNNLITQGTLYRIPTLGGTPRKVADNVSGAVSLSPDNRREAFLRNNNAAGQDELIVGEVEGFNQIRVAARKYPQRFAFSSAPAWSPDGETIAVASESTDAKGFYVTMVGVRLKDRAEKVLCHRRWQYIEQLAWLPGKHGLLALGRDQESSFLQIWQVLSPDGEPRRVTNDLNDYHGISLSADSASLVTAQAQTLSNVWMMGGGKEARRVTSGYGRYFDLSASGDKIVYASDASGRADIWSMDLDGSNQHQLTSNAQRNYSPSASPDGRHIAFHSNRTGTWNIWTMNRDGGDLNQLTNDANDSNWPVWTPDGKYIVYHHIGRNGYQTVWKIPAEGGTPAALTDRLSLHPAVSPRDGTVACWYAEDPADRKWQIALLPPNGGRPLRTFSFPSTASVDSTLRWTPDGRGITYADVRGGVSNIWLQDIEGGPPRNLVRFSGERVFSLDWSPKGELIYSRGLRISDVVLITDAK